MKINHSVEHALLFGAALLPITFNGGELEALKEFETDMAAAEKRVPRFGNLIKEIVDTLGVPLDSGPWLTFANPEVDDGGMAIAHTDSEISRGMTVLVPVDGPRADFYNADFEFALPYDAPHVQHLRYGQGNALLVRQDVQVDAPGGRIELPATFHLGLAQAARTIRVCDLHFSDAICAL